MSQAKKKGGKQKKPTSRAFGKELGGIYKVVNFIHKYRLYRLTRFVPYSGVIGFSYFFTKVFFTKSKATNARIKRDILLFSGRTFSPRLLKGLVEATLKNMGLILFDVMLKAPNVTQQTYRKLVALEGDSYLEDALKAGKGAILTSLHVGQFFHTVGAIALDPRGFKLLVVANMANQLVFENLVTLPPFRSAKVVGRAGYKDIKAEMIEGLKANKVVFLMHDMGGNNNLKVPFISGEKDFLVNVPQGAIALHRATGAPIVPVLAIPRGRFTESTLTFFDPAPILRVSEACKRLPQKEYHGRMSIEINKILFPHLVKYLHTWEEIITIGTRTFDIKLRFPKGAELPRIITDIDGWIKGQIDGSFEPGRKDEALLAWVTGLMAQLQGIAAKAGASNPGFQLAAKSYVQLGGMGTQAQVEKLLLVMKMLLGKAGMQSGVQLLSDNLGTVRDFYPPRD
jgi:lauroyl/myristoyl acyltransferase